MEALRICVVMNDTCSSLVAGGTIENSRKSVIPNIGQLIIINRGDAVHRRSALS